MNYILDYELINDKLQNLKNLKKNKSVKTRFGYEIPYYIYGSGSKHIVFVGGTHGSEIISVDFVLNLMDEISNKKNIFKDFDSSDYTFHFIPVHNPEGFIVSTSAIRTKISRDMPLSECEKICKEYYLKYKIDDINVNNDKNDRSLKEHQKMFKNATYECIPDIHPKLKDSIKNIFSNDKLPPGSMICYRANGIGIELNRNTIFNHGLEDIKNKREVYATNRYNNILNTIPGPIGIPCNNIDNFEYEIENIFLYKLLDNLDKENKLSCCFLFHGTGGEIYYKPIMTLDKKEYKKKLKENYKIAKIYQKYTDYKFMDNKDKIFESFDGFLRTAFKKTLLIELSKMGGNPIGPYGDIKNNYIPTINNNLIAIRNILDNKTII